MGGDDAGKPGSGTYAVPPELSSGQDMLVWKREYNIRLREADWKRRQEELLMQKQVAWQIQKLERENRLTSAREARRKQELEGRVTQRHVEVDRSYKERCRAVEIETRNAAWEEKENARLKDMHDEAQEVQAAAEQARAEEKEQKCEEMRQGAADRAEKKRRDAELNARREENMRKKEQMRQARAIENAQQLKRDSAARTQAVVNGFTQRVVPLNSNIMSILTAKPPESDTVRFGANLGGII